MTVAIVLGGGGVRGAAWLMGALHGLVEETGWDPAGADLLVGTSAGAVVAALTVAGVRPWESLAPERRDLLEALTRAAEFRPQLSVRSLAPGSLPLAARAALAGPGHVMKLVAGLAPHGYISTATIADLVRDQAGGGWPSGRELWVVATDFGTGERVVFGRAGAPTSELASAVAASCAVPGFYRPVGIGERTYVDGGVQSGANLDLLAGTPPELVICANPLSSVPDGLRSLASPLRILLHRQLEGQMRQVEREGCRLVVLEPAADSIDLIGFNPMSRRRGTEIGRVASLEVREHLRRPEVREKLLPIDQRRARRGRVGGR
jgi:NTE family protein